MVFAPAVARGTMLAVRWSHGDAEDAASGGERDAPEDEEVLRFYPLLYTERRE